MWKIIKKPIFIWSISGFILTGSAIALIVSLKNKEENPINNMKIDKTSKTEVSAIPIDSNNFGGDLLVPKFMSQRVDFSEKIDDNIYLLDHIKPVSQLVDDFTFFTFSSKTEFFENIKKMF